MIDSSINGLDKIEINATDPEIYDKNFLSNPYIFIWGKLL